MRALHKDDRMQGRMPEMAIIENNTLAMMGLKQLLETVMPMMNICTFGSFAEFESNNPDRFIHYFVSMHIVLAHRNFFVQGQRAHHTIVLTPSNDPNSQLNDFHCLCVSVPEETLVKHPCHARNRQGESSLRPRDRGVGTRCTRKNKQRNSRYAVYRPLYRNHAPQEHSGEIRTEVGLLSYYLCGDAWLCGHQQDMMPAYNFTLEISTRLLTMA